MLISEQKPLAEILASLNGEKKIFLVGCRGCAEGCESGGEQQVIEMKQQLEGEGKTITGISVIDTLCNEALVRTRIKPREDEVQAADSVLVMTCGIGTQITAAVVDKVTHPGCNTISLGGAHAEWLESDLCLECGDCVLDYTGGICPIAKCSKHLLNGPCGGSQGGRCEVDPDVPCVWQLIYDRLEKIGRLDKLEEIKPPKNWSVSLIGGTPPKRKAV
jgi:ferredoxin